MIIVFLGNSGSGKDTACDYLVDTFNFHKVHPTDDLKTFLERHWNLPVGSASQNLFKNNIPVSPTSTYTLQDIQLKLCSFLTAIDPEFTKYYLEETLTMTEFYDYCLTGVRFRHEVDVILEKFRETNLLFVHLKRESSKVFKSDTLLQDNINHIKDNGFLVHELDNNGSLYELEIKMKKLMNETVRWLPFNRICAI